MNHEFNLHFTGTRDPRGDHSQFFHYPEDPEKFQKEGF